MSKNKVFFGRIRSGIKSSWTKYHLLVPLSVWKKGFAYLWEVVTGNSRFLNPMNIPSYNMWLKEQEPVMVTGLKYNPLVSVLVPVYNADPKCLKECIESVLSQSYENFELCLVDDASSSEETKKVLKSYEKNKKIKIKYRKKNGHISRATNDALNMAKGEYVAFVDNDDTLDKDALYCVVSELNKNKKLDLIYTDEDKLDQNGKRCYPHFKSDWSPDTLLSLNYICHLVVVRKSLVEKVGGLTVGLEGAQDHDLLLKITEQTNNIYHIPKVLYHWRMIEGSTALNLDNKDYAADKGKLAIEAALKRRKLKGIVEKDPVSTYYRVLYDIKKEPLVSVIIPTKDHAKTTEACLKTVFEKTTYKNFEVLLVDNRSKEKETLELFEKYKQKYQNFRVIPADMKFNYSKINNLAVKQAKGEYIILLNNDTEVITPEWMTYLVGYAMLPHAGAVGAKLLYPDNTIQHVGVALGLGGVAGHTDLGMGRDEPGIYGRVRVPYDVGAVTAACLCVNKKKFTEVHGLEEKGLTVAFNDIDLNMKLAKRGYYNIVLPMVELYHHESKSRGTDLAPGKRERFENEVHFMQNKWGDALFDGRFYNPNYSMTQAYMLEKKEKK